MKVPHKSRPAATVILLRPVKVNGFEVFLIRRPDGMAFLGGMYGFPGGALLREDCSAKMLRLSHGLSPVDARKIVGAHLPTHEALGLWVAGIRELFEEAGILLAVSKSGRPWAKKQNFNNNLADKHAALLKETLSFRTLLESEELLCDASRLAYFSHWQTPGQIEIRFDTRFFLAALPSDQTPLPTSPEVAHSLWLTPDRALELFAKGKLPMIFPTFASIRTLADFQSLESVWKEYVANSSAASKKGSRGR
jgi:8-oxo-dGTP pyrophosphatase MutT (NUDIX family)